MQATEHRFIHIPSSALVLSIALHVLIPLGFLAAGVMDDMGLSLFPKNKQLDSLYQTYIQVDVVGLPDEIISDKTNPLMPEVVEPEKALKEEPKTTAPAPDVMDEINQKKKAAQAKKDRAAQEKAMKKALDEARRDQAMKSLKSSQGKAGRGKIKGNIVSAGTSATGAIGTPKDRYHGILTESIKQHFNIYSWQQKRGLVAQVKLKLGMNGRVKIRQIVLPSRDPLYDAAVLQAIDEAQPFPLPDDKALLDEEITIDFKP